MLTSFLQPCKKSIDDSTHEATCPKNLKARNTPGTHNTHVNLEHNTPARHKGTKAKMMFPNAKPHKKSQPKSQPKSRAGARAAPTVQPYDERTVHAEFKALDPARDSTRFKPAVPEDEEVASDLESVETCPADNDVSDIDDLDASSESNITYITDEEAEVEKAARKPSGKRPVKASGAPVFSGPEQWASCDEFSDGSLSDDKADCFLVEQKMLSRQRSRLADIHTFSGPQLWFVQDDYIE